MRNHAKTTILSALCLLLTMLCSVCFVACNTSSTSTTSQTPIASTYVSIDVNPSIELVLDQNDNVMSVAGANEDARVLLFREDGIVGANVNVAIENIASLAVEYGYLTESNSTVDVCVAASSKDKQKSLFDVVSDSFKKGAQSVNSALSVQVGGEISLSLNFELERIKAQFPDDENVKNLSVSNLKLINRAIEANPSLSVADLASKSIEELISATELSKYNAEYAYGDLYKKQIEQAKLVYNNTVQTLEGTFYIKHFALKAFHDKDLGSLAKTIAAIKYTSANAYILSLEYYKARFAEYFVNPTYTISMSDVDEIASALGVTSDLFIDGIGATISQGKASLKKNDLLLYIDKLHRNASIDQKANVAQVYGDVLDKYLTSADEDEEDLLFSTQDVEKSIVAIKAALAQYSVVMSLAGFDVDVALDQSKPSDVDYDDYSSIESAIASLKTVAQSAREDMALTDEEEAQIEEEFASAKSAFDEALKVFTTAKEKAINDAIARLSEIKQSRKESAKQ